MSLSEYAVVINGYPATVQLSESDAKARGLTAADKAGAKPATKARTRVRNKAV